MYDDKERPTSLLVFDLETVVDCDVCSSVFSCSCKDYERCELAVKAYHLAATNGVNSFPKQLFHRIVAIGYTSCDINYEYGSEEFILRGIHSIKDVEKNEQEALIKFFSLIERKKPRLVSFNGRGFDIPVLKYRSMKYGLSSILFGHERRGCCNYNYRYADNWHCDLLDVLSDFSASSRNIKLHEVCSLINIPGKFGIEGNQVSRLYLDNNMEEINEYCETDTLSTYLVYLRYMLNQKKISHHMYEKAVQEAISYIKSSPKRRMREFYEEWQKHDCKLFSRDDAP